MSPAMNALWQPVRRRVLIATGCSAWFTVFTLTLFVFLLTAHWQASQNTDGLVAAIAGWHLVNHGSLDLSGYVEPNSLPGVLEVGDRIVVARTMGVILSGLPGAILLGWTGASPAITGALSAALFSAAAVANVHLSVRRLVPGSAAALGALVLGLGTGMWTVAAAELWTHGPDAFWLSVVLVMASSRRWLLTGLAFAPAILTRPHLAVAAAVVGIWMSSSLRSWRPVLAVGLPSAAAVGLMIYWNSWYYETVSVGGTYGYAVPNATRAPDEGLGIFAENVAGVLFSPLSGLFVYSPILFVVVWAVAAGHWHQPAWATACAVAGIVYLAVQMRISASFDGGASYYGNRYSIETLVLMAPFAIAAVTQWSREAPVRLTVVSAAASTSVAIYAFGALLAYGWTGIGTASSWTTWYPLHVARTSGPAGIAMATACISLVGLSVLLTQKRCQGATSASPERAQTSRS